jgi:hypothetical protein
MRIDVAEAVAAIRDALKTRITPQVHTAGRTVPEEDLAQIQHVILGMTIAPELQAMLLRTAWDPADWARLEPDRPQMTQVVREALAFARAALTDLPPRFAQAIMYNSRGALMLERRKRVGVSAYMWRMLLGGGHGVPNASRIAC